MVRAAAPRQERLRPIPTRTLAAIAAVCLVVFAVLAVVVWHAHGPVGLDDALGAAAYRQRPAMPIRWLGDGWNEVGRVARLGSPQFVFGALAVVAIVAYVQRDRLAALVCIAGPALGGVCELIAKPTVDRLYGTSLSYPSGHATLSAGLAAAVVFVVFRFGGPRAATILAVPAAAIPLFVSIALVRIGWHYPTDVIGGAALGIGSVCATALMVGSARRGRRQSPELAAPPPSI